MSWGPCNSFCFWKQNWWDSKFCCHRYSKNSFPCVCVCVSVRACVCVRAPSTVRRADVSVDPTSLTNTQQISPAFSTSTCAISSRATAPSNVSVISCADGKGFSSVRNSTVKTWGQHPKFGRQKVVWRKPLGIWSAAWARYLRRFKSIALTSDWSTVSLKRQDKPSSAGSSDLALGEELSISWPDHCWSGMRRHLDLKRRSFAFNADLVCQGPFHHGRFWAEENFDISANISQIFAPRFFSELPPKDSRSSATIFHKGQNTSAAKQTSFGGTSPQKCSTRTSNHRFRNCLTSEWWICQEWGARCSHTVAKSQILSPTFS